MTQTADLRPLWEQPEIRARRWQLLGVLCLSLIMVVMSVSGLNVALPTLQQDLGASATELQWIVDAYSLVFAGLLLLAGALGDKFGRKRSLQLGLIVFGLGSLISATASGAELIIVGRSVSGIGAAFVMPATLSLIATVFAPDERVKAIAIWAGFAGAGSALGPIISGGLLNAGFWWGATILVNVPVAALTLVAVTVLSPTSKDDTDAPLDPIGAVLSLVGLAGLLFGIIEGPNGWTQPAVIAAVVIGIVGLVGFVFWELRSKHPMLPMQFFRVPSFSISAGVISTAFFMLFGFFFLITQYLQFVKGYSPLRAGFATLPLGLALVVVSPRSAAIGQRVGSTKVVAGGFIAIAIGFGLLSQVEIDSPYLVIFAAVVLLGAGMGSTAAVSTGQLMSSVPPSKAGVGSAVNDTSREVGGAFGIAVLGSIATAQYRSGIELDGLALPGGVESAARESIGGALASSAELSPDAAQRLVATASGAFTDAVSVVMLIGTLVAIAASIIVVIVGRRLPSLPRAHDPDALADV